MEPVLFTIITVSFNSEKTIERTIKSILSQSIDDYEYLIIDGKSTDQTINIIKQYEESFKGRLRWISEPDSGIYNAMNKGISKARGLLIGIVNSDDWLEPDALENVRNSFYSQNYSLECIYCGWLNFCYDNQRKIILKTSRQEFENNANKFFTLVGIRHPAVVVPREIYSKYGAFDESIKITADADFLHRLLFHSVKFIFIDKIISNMSDGGISNNSLNLKVLQVRLRDYKIRISKYRISKIRKIYLLLRFSVLLIIKSTLPERIIKQIRKNRNK